MRWLIATLIFTCTACQSADQVASPQPTTTKTVPSRVADTKQRVHAFGGVINGTDVGEFGGGVSFTEPDGTTYQIISDNSHGIFNTSHGVIAITGLAHMSINRGSVYLLTREPGKNVTATATLQLPGAPCNDATLSNEELSLRVFTDIGTDGPRYQCFLLQTLSQLVEQQCAPEDFGLDKCFD